MKSILQGLAGFAMLFCLVMCSSCAEPQRVSRFIISPPAGMTEISAEDISKLCQVLDGVALQYKMPKQKSGQLGIIRYYQATSTYEIGFFAKREPTRLTVFAQPMMPSVAHKEYFTAFRQNLANVLSREFPGQVSLEK